MAGPFRSLDDLARKGFDLNVKCPCGKYERTIPIAEVRAMFRARKRSEDWHDAHRRWRCAWCGSRVERVKLAAYPATDPDALAVIRQAALPMRQPQPRPEQVKDALVALPENTPAAAIQGFWAAYEDHGGLAAGRAAGLHTALIAIERALGRYHDDASDMIEHKFGKRYAVPMTIADLTDAELPKRWNELECTDEGTSPEEDALAEEIERRGLDG